MGKYLVFRQSLRTDFAALRPRFHSKPNILIAAVTCLNFYQVKFKVTIGAHLILINNSHCTINRAAAIVILNLPRQKLTRVTAANKYFVAFDVRRTHANLGCPVLLKR